MKYQYAAKINYEDYASGRVIYHKSGLATFPVRFALEILYRCLQKSIKQEELCLYDPLCGQGYLLTVLGLHEGERVKQLFGSDINASALEVANKNLGLLQIEGLHKRKTELELMYHAYHKTSHLEALTSIDTFIQQKQQRSSQVQTKVFEVDILIEQALKPANFRADIIISDVPYGKMVNWSKGSGNEMNILLTNLQAVIHKDSIIAIVSDKNQKIKHPAYQRLEIFKIGKRKVEILCLAD